MTSEKFQGISLDEQIETVGEQSEFLFQKMKELKELKQLRDEMKIEVIKELEKKYDFKGFNENMSDFIEKFDDFLVSLDDYIKTGSEPSKTSLLKKLPILRDIIIFKRDMDDG